MLIDKSIWELTKIFGLIIENRGNKIKNINNSANEILSRTSGKSKIQDRLDNYKCKKKAYNNNLSKNKIRGR